MFKIRAIVVLATACMHAHINSGLHSCCFVMVKLVIFGIGGSILE